MMLIGQVALILDKFERISPSVSLKVPNSYPALKSAFSWPSGISGLIRPNKEIQILERSGLTSFRSKHKKIRPQCVTFLIYFLFEPTRRISKSSIDHDAALDRVIRYSLLLPLLNNANSSPVLAVNAAKSFMLTQDFLIMY